jgi:YfiH family protein
MKWITANFPYLAKEVQDKIFAITTTRYGGVSNAPYEELNLALHVEDVNAAVQTNRAILREQLELPTEPFWLNQTHSTNVLHLSSKNTCFQGDFDASFTRDAYKVSVVLTADCLPLLITNSSGSEVASIHGGWRGLLNGVIENTLDNLDSTTEELHVWMGPAIGPNAFEVGVEVRDQFVENSIGFTHCFTPKGEKYLCDIYQVATVILKKAGVKFISGGQYCTYSDKQFFSYRRDGKTGRIASLIWFR